MKIVHQNLLLPFEGNIEGEWGKLTKFDEPQDSFLAVSNDGVMGAEVVLTDPKPVGKGDAIRVQHIQRRKTELSD